MVDLILYRSHNQIKSLKWSDFISNERYNLIRGDAMCAYAYAFEAGFLCPEIEDYRNGIRMKYDTLTIWIEPHYGASYYRFNQPVQLINWSTFVEEINDIPKCEIGPFDEDYEWELD